MLTQSEALILRTYPFREADLLVTFFTRAEGKLRGVAKSAKRSRKRFGGALEPLTLVRAHWQEREGADLVRLESCEVLRSPLATSPEHPLDYPRLLALSHVAEMLDELLPDREANDAIFRLSTSVLAVLTAAPARHVSEHAANGSAHPAPAAASSSATISSTPIWLPIAYFDLWMLRLVGFLPPLDECLECGAPLASRAAYFHALRDGLTCPEHRHIATSELSAESRAIAARIFRLPVESIAQESVPANRLADLRKFLMQILHRHLDRRLETSALLDRLG